MNKRRESQSGFVTVEFLIAIAIAFGLTLLTFALTFTLSTVESFQYIVFASSRAHAAASYDVDSQKKAARNKYQKLIDDPAFKSLFTNGWFEVSKASDLEIKSGGPDGNFANDYSSSDNRGNLQGVRAKFTAHLLEMRLPFLGAVAPEDNGFSARINTILLREVSYKECEQFMEDRKEALWQFGGNRFSRFKKSSTIPTPWEDNGC